MLQVIECNTAGCLPIVDDRQDLVVLRVHDLLLLEVLYLGIRFFMNSYGALWDTFRRSDSSSTVVCLHA